MRDVLATIAAHSALAPVAAPLARSASAATVLASPVAHPASLTATVAIQSTAPPAPALGAAISICAAPVTIIAGPRASGATGTAAPIGTGRVVGVSIRLGDRCG